MRIAICILLAIWGIGISQGYTYQYSQVVENLRGPLGNTIVTWKTSTEEYSVSYTDPYNLFNVFTPTRLVNLEKAYGKLLNELGIEDNPNRKSNKIRFLDYLGFLGWKLVWVQDLEGKTIYQFEKAIVE